MLSFTKKITKNDIIVLSVFIINGINVVLNCKQNILPAFISLFLILFQLSIYNFKELGINKKAFIMTGIAVAIFAPIVESIIIYYSNGNTWRYAYPFMNWNIPLWLIPGYGMLGMACIHHYFTYLSK